MTGPFVAMIRYMIVRDLKQFSLIYLVFLCSFAQCIFFVNYKQDNSINNNATAMVNNDERGNNTNRDSNKGESDENIFIKLLASYLELWMELFKMTLGVYDLQPYRHSSLARLFFLLFIYLIPILFNM